MAYDSTTPGLGAPVPNTCISHDSKDKQNDIGNLRTSGACRYHTSILSVCNAFRLSSSPRLRSSFLCVYDICPIRRGRSFVSTTMPRSWHFSWPRYSSEEPPPYTRAESISLCPCFWNTSSMAAQSFRSCTRTCGTPITAVRYSTYLNSRLRR